MDRVPEPPQGCLVERLCQSWMGVYRPCHVLEARTHLDRQRELADEFGNVRAHRLDAEHAMIVVPGDHADKPAILPRLHAQRAAIGRKRKLSNDHIGAAFVGLTRG